MGTRQGGTNGTVNGGLPHRNGPTDKPARAPLDRIEASSSRHTLTFPKRDANEAHEASGADDRASQSAEPPRSRSLELILQNEPEMADGERPVSPPFVRWTTPSRRLTAPRAVERAARSSDRLLRNDEELSARFVDEILAEHSEREAARTPSQHRSDRPTVRRLSEVIVDSSSSEMVAERSSSEMVAERSSSEMVAERSSSEMVAERSSSAVMDLSASDLESDRAAEFAALPAEVPPPLPEGHRRAEVPPPLPEGHRRAGVPPPLPEGHRRAEVPPPLPERASPVIAVGAPRSGRAPTSVRPPVRPLPWAFGEKAGRTAERPRAVPASDADEAPPHESLEWADSANQAHEERRAPASRSLSPSSPPASPASSIAPSRFAAAPALGITLAQPTRKRLRGALWPLVVTHATLAALVAMAVGVGRAPSEARSHREPRVAVPEWSPLAAAASEPPPPPLRGCAASGASRLLARRARVGPGLDVSVLDTGFAVGLASGPTEAVGLRVEGAGLRVAETVRVRAPSVVSHVTVEQAHDEESEGLDVRVDSDDTRTVVGGDGPAFRIIARGGGVLALLDDLRGVRVRPLWSLPGAARPLVAAPPPNPYQPPGVAVTAPSPRPAPPFARSGGEPVWAAGRDDGGAVVALRRASTLWLGVADGALAPSGPLVSIVRDGATLGAPAVAPWRGGGVVAWAEKAGADREWTILVAGFSPNEDGATEVEAVREIAKGTSPTIAALPDGDLLVAYAEGPPGAQRVVARRLASDLEARGETLVLSPASLNADQPVAAVRADGRALVAFFAADRGRSASVHAASLACDPGL